MKCVLVLLVALTACHSTAPHIPQWPDAPLQLRDDSDRDQAIDSLWAMPLGAERDRVRDGIADAIASRIGDALEDDKPYNAEELLFQLISLWQSDPQSVGRGLASHVELFKSLRATFAKSGALEPTIATLVLLAEVEPGHRDAYLGELDEVLHFSDDLEAAENGNEAERAQPIALLQPTVLALPLRSLVDRYVTLLVDRQRVISTLITKQGASIELVRAHHDILATSLRIAIALARAGRTEEIYSRIANIKGLGQSPQLALRAELVAERPSADTYYDLAEQIRNDKDNGDPAGALAVCLAGLRKFPTDSSLLGAAAGDAAALGRVDQPIALYEAAIKAQGGEVDSALAFRVGKLYAERIARLAFGGRPEAAKQSWREVEHKTQKSPEDVWRLVAANAETALGKGLLSQGRMREAERALVASIGRAPSIEAYETLATIHYKTDRFASATRYANAGIALLGESKADHMQRAKLDRIAGDVARVAGRAREASGLYLDALKMWGSLGPDSELPPAVRSERKLEFARALWYVGESGKAVNLVFDAIDAEPENAANYASAVAFLLTVGNYADALDIVHRALTQADVSEFYRVYMCLWVLADAKRRGEPRDPQAVEFLASRQGDLWYELLAKAATGRVDVSALTAAATTAPRQAELAFYRVALALDAEAVSAAGSRKLLEQVVDAHLVMDAEYDLARQYLSRP
jgi:tetratricopeptide (TPR) repeat protein